MTHPPAKTLYILATLAACLAVLFVVVHSPALAFLWSLIGGVLVGLGRRAHA